MELPAKNSLHPLNIAKLLEDHKGEDTVVLNLKDLCSWTDYFVITTVRSQTHMRGLLKHLDSYFNEHSIVQLNKRKNVFNAGWILIDCGNFVVHLMETEQREFYELEKLWFKGKEIYHSSISS